MNLWIRVRYVVRLFTEDNGQSKGVCSHITTRHGVRKLSTIVSPALCCKFHILNQLMQTSWLYNKYYTIWVCVYSHSHSACNAYAPYCHLWRAPLYNIFPHYLINGTIFENRSLNIKMCVLIFSTNFFWNIVHSKKNSAIYDEKCALFFMLTFRHRASCIYGQAFRYSPENALYIFNQQIYFIIWYLLDRASLI